MMGEWLVRALSQAMQRRKKCAAFLQRTQHSPHLEEDDGRGDAVGGVQRRALHIGRLGGRVGS